MIARFRSLFCLLGIVAIVPIAGAQRVAVGDFEGNWRGTLTMNVVYDVPDAHLERLSKPVQLEIRIFNRGGAELYYTGFEEDEWEFQTQRGFRITMIGTEHGIIEARIPGLLGWTNSMTFNLTKQGDGTLFLAWTRLTIRSDLLFDGLDEMAFAGTARLTRAAAE